MDIGTEKEEKDNSKTAQVSVSAGWAVGRGYIARAQRLAVSQPLLCSGQRGRKGPQSAIAQVFLLLGLRQGCVM